MKKLLFVHDHKFRKIGNDFFSTGGLSQTVLDRYIRIFGEITIIARIIVEEELDEKYSKIDLENVEIIDGRYLSLKDFNNLIKESKHIICRIPSVFSYKVALLSKMQKRTFLVELVACSWDILFNHSIRGKIMALPSYLLTKYIVRNSKFVLYVTNRFLQKRYPTKGTSVGISDVVLNSVSDSILEDRLHRISYKEGSDKKYVLGTISALDVKYKGQRYVIEALGELKKNGITNFEYQLVGGGESTNIQRCIEKNDLTSQVKIIGAMPHSNVFDWLDNIDLYIQPSKTEGFPRAVIEAMSRAVPVIGSTAGGIPELIDKNYIVNKNNLSEGIKRILTNLKKNEMVYQSEKNFLESKKYQTDILNDKRNKFLLEFKKSTH